MGIRDDDWSFSVLISVEGSLPCTEFSPVALTLLFAKCLQMAISTILIVVSKESSFLGQWEDNYWNGCKITAVINNYYINSWPMPRNGSTYIFESPVIAWGRKWFYSSPMYVFRRKKSKKKKRSPERRRYTPTEPPNLSESSSDEEPKAKPPPPPAPAIGLRYVM